MDWILSWPFPRCFPKSCKGLIFVTGTSTGIGRHAVEHLARKFSNHVIVAGVRKETDAAMIVDLRIENLRPLIVDITNEKQCLDAVEYICEFARTVNLPLVGVVNNAGAARLLPVEFHDIHDARALFEVNFFGAALITQMLIPLLRESNGRIVFVSSFAGLFAAPLGGFYSSTKYAIEGLADSLRREMSHFDVSVSLIEPGYIKTAIVESSIINSRLSPERTSVMHSVYKRFYGVTHLGTSGGRSNSDSSNNNDTAEDIKKLEVSGGSHPLVVSEAITHALMSRFPKTRYVVGTTSSGLLPAYILAWIVWALPDRLQDWIIGCY